MKLVTRLATIPLLAAVSIDIATVKWKRSVLLVSAPLPLHRG
jgi:hypothetical protein